MKVKSNAVRDDIIAEAVKKHASFDQSFDSIPPYVLVYPDFREVFFIPGTENLFVLSEYKQALCKESYKRLTFYLVQRDEFHDNSDDFGNSPEPQSKIPDQPVLPIQTRLEDYMLPDMEGMYTYNVPHLLNMFYSLIRYSICAGWALTFCQD